MIIDDNTQDFPGDGWCVVVVNRKWPAYFPLGAFVDPQVARRWLNDHDDATGRYALYAVPLSTVRQNGGQIT